MLLAVKGEPDLKTRFAETRFKFNFTSMTVADDAVPDHQAKAGAGADGFRGEEWLEHACLNVGRNAGAIVHNFDDELIVFQRSANTDFAGAIYRGDRIINQIER